MDGSIYNPYNDNDFVSQSKVNAEDIGSLSDQLSWFKFILTFMFTSWEISGIPAVIGFFLTLVNLVTSVSCVIWTINKVRGIG